MALTKLTKNLIDGTFGTEWDSTIQTSNFTAVAGKGYFVNTTSAAITVTLPAGVVGNEIIIQDYAGTFGTNKVLVSANGSEKIQGSTDNVQNTTNNATITLVYQDATKGWTADNISTEISSVSVTYLIIAGGGAGPGPYGGGGGAGGMKSGTANITLAQNYTLTVGAGGTSGTSVSDGNDSVALGLTSTAGGSGGIYDTGTPSLGTGRTGGSGGGGASGPNSPNPGGSGQAGEGNDGGTANNSGGYQSAGGGGAGAAGADISGQGGAGGAGGVGLANTITGSSVFYAGGGGGSGYTGVGGTGGNGGGGNGAQWNGGSYSNGTSGTANTGGGGGGGMLTGSGGNGGSGVVILRYSNTFTISGLSGTTTTVGSDKVTTFTNVGTGNIQFN